METINESLILTISVFILGTALIFFLLSIGFTLFTQKFPIMKNDKGEQITIDPDFYESLENLKNNFNKLVSLSGSIKDQVDKDSETFKILQENNSKLSNQLIKHEKRWDVYNKERLIDSLISCHIVLKQESKENDLSSQIEFVEHRIHNALKELGVEVLIPKGTNENFEEISHNYDQNISTLKTKDESKVGKISRITKPGYTLKDSNNTEKVIRKPTVEIYIKD